MALQDKGTNLLSKPLQRNPGRSHTDPERHRILPFSSQHLSPQTQYPSSCPEEQVGVSRTGLTCPRCRASRGHRPGCPQCSTIHEREAIKQCEREKMVQQARYETSLAFNEPVDAAYGLARHPVGSASLPSSAWPAAVISSADDVPSLLPLRSTTATPTTPPGDQHVPATLANLCEGVQMPGTLSPQHEDRFAAVHHSVTNRRPTTFAPPDSHPSSPSSLTYCQSKSTTNAGIPATAITHRDQLSGDPRHRTPFDLSSGLPSPDYLLTVPVRPTHKPKAEPRLNARCSLLESSHPLTADRISSPTIHGSCSGSRNLSTLSLHPRAAPGPAGTAQVSMPQPPNENRKRSFSAFSAEDSLIVLPSRNSDSRSSLRHTAPYAEFYKPVVSRAALCPSSYLGECTQPQPPCSVTDPLPTTMDRVYDSLPPEAMKVVSQPPAWPNSPNISSFAPAFAASTTNATAWPLSSPPPPPALPRPVPGYVWMEIDWHGPFWTLALPGHIAAANYNAFARSRCVGASAKASANDDAALGDYKSKPNNPSNDDEDEQKAAHAPVKRIRRIIRRFERGESRFGPSVYGGHE